MFVKITYKKDTIDMFTPLKIIKKEITNDLLRRRHPLHKIIYEIWYDYIH